MKRRVRRVLTIVADMAGGIIMLCWGAVWLMAVKLIT